MKKSKTLFSIVALLALIVVTGCKPTENNYRQAYETAQKARQQERDEDAALGIPQLQSVDGPRTQRVGNDSVYVRREAVTLQGAAPKSGMMTANVAVGKYKMTANALADAETLRGNGFDSFVLATPNGEFYAVAGSAKSLEDAVVLLKKVREKFPRRPYIGLPSEPVIIVPLGSRF